MLKVASSTDSPRQEARRYASRLLADLRLPAGFKRTVPPPGDGRLLRPMLPDELGDVVRVRAFYRVAMPMSAVRRFLIRRTPPTLRPGDNARLGHAGAALAEYLTYVPRDLPAHFSGAALAVAIAPSSHGGSVLRADAQVAFYPKRSSAEYIRAAHYRSVTL